MIDDYWISALLLAGAWAMKSDSLRSRALLAAGWGANAGMLYGSFFGKLIEPTSSNPGNFEIGLLTGLIGLAWAVSVIGVIASVMLPGGHAPKVRVP